MIVVIGDLIHVKKSGVVSTFLLDDKSYSKAKSIVTKKLDEGFYIVVDKISDNVCIIYGDDGLHLLRSSNINEKVISLLS